MTRTRRLFPLALAFACSWLASPASTRADIVNGDFSAGLSGWTASDPGLVSVVSGAAVLRESPTDSQVDLYQDFTVPVDATTLTFRSVTVGTEDDFLVAGFGASLLDPSTQQSLVPTVDALTDSFYTRDLDPGTTSGLAASGVTVSPGADALPLLITLDVSGLGGREARILFRLIGGGGASDASVTIDDVTVRARSVPEPASLALVSAGLAAAFASSRVRSRHEGRRASPAMAPTPREAP